MKSVRIFSPDYNPAHKYECLKIKLKAITQAAFEQVKESFQCQPIGEFSLKNKAKPTMVYEVLT